MTSNGKVKLLGSVSDNMITSIEASNLRLEQRLKNKSSRVPKRDKMSKRRLFVPRSKRPLTQKPFQSILAGVK